MKIDIDVIIRRWSYRDSLLPVEPVALPPEFDELLAYLRAQRVEDHPFFKLAANEPHALRVWASQEAVVTGPFSQLLLAIASQIDNVHIRTAFLSVVIGEHHSLQDGVARRSHPYLLHRMCESIGVAPDSVVAIAPTVQFLRTLGKCCETLIGGIGALSIGNEAMLIPEYTAVKDAFAASLESTEAEAFLMANVSADESHTRTLLQVAADLISLGSGSIADFDKAARRAIDARVLYYDALVDMLKG